MENTKTKYIITILLTFGSIFVVLHFFEVNKHEQYIWVFYALYLFVFILSFLMNKLKGIFLIINRIFLILWLLTYPIGLVFALIGSIQLAIQISLSFYLLPLIALYFNFKSNI